MGCGVLLWPLAKAHRSALGQFEYKQTPRLAGSDSHFVAAAALPAFHVVRHGDRGVSMNVCVFSLLPPSECAYTVEHVCVAVRVGLCGLQVKQIVQLQRSCCCCMVVADHPVSCA